MPINSAIEREVDKRKREHLEAGVADGTADLSCETIQAKPFIVSVLCVDQSMMGGAHPMTTWFSFNFAVGPTHVERLALADLFPTDLAWKAKLTQMCLDDLRRKKRLMDEPEPDRVAKALDDVAWVLKDDALSLQFDTYALGSRVDGPVTIDIPYSRLIPFLRPGCPAQQLNALLSHR